MNTNDSESESVNLPQTENNGLSALSDDDQGASRVRNGSVREMLPLTIVQKRVEDSSLNLRIVYSVMNGTVTMTKQNGTISTK